MTDNHNLSKSDPNTASPYLVAVGMPVLNEARYIGQTLEQLLEQDFPMDKVEVVVGDGGSTDGTREIIESFQGRFGSLKVADNIARLPSSGRNVGVKLTTAPYFIVLDGHCYIPNRKLLKQMVELFERTNADCLCRPQPLNPPGISEFQTAVALCRDSALGHKPGSEIYANHEAEVDPTSSGAMYRRSVFSEIGYFDERFDACEDVDFNFRVHRAGLKAFLSPRLAILYYPRENVRGLWRQMGRYGRGRYRFAKKHNEFSLIQWFSGAAVAGFMLLALLAIFFESALSLLLIATGGYLLLVALFSVHTAMTKGVTSVLKYGLFIFPTIHFGLGYGFLKGLFEDLFSSSKPLK